MFLFKNGSTGWMCQPYNAGKNCTITIKDYRTIINYHFCYLNKVTLPALSNKEPSVNFPFALHM